MAYPGLCDENGIDVLGLRRSVEREREEEGRCGRLSSGVWGLPLQGRGVRRSMDMTSSMGIHKAGKRDRAKERLERAGRRFKRAGNKLVVSEAL